MRKTLNANFMQKSVLAAAIASVAGVAQAEDAASLHQAIAEGTADLSLRYRYEYVDDSSKVANASTLKTRLTYKTQSFEGLSALLEFDNNSEVLGDDYNSGVNGKTEHAVVADPAYTEVNQAYVDYAAPADTLVRAGRQRILLDNQRFVGGVGWRQNEQTYDAIALINKSLPDTTISGVYVNNVNNIFGKNINDEDHAIIHINNKSVELANVSAYAYLLEDISDTYGLRLTGKTAVGESNSVMYELEYATQDQAAGPEADYLHAALGGSISGITCTLGYELQESDNGTGSFKTPLGTNHKFGGWADQFLATPAAGLEDTYASISTKKLGPKITLAYHMFSADEGSTDFGDEVDLAIATKIQDNYGVLLKYAHFNGDDGKNDVDKLWVQLTAKF